MAGQRVWGGGDGGGFAKTTEGNKVAQNKNYLHGVFNTRVAV